MSGSYLPVGPRAPRVPRQARRPERVTFGLISAMASTTAEHGAADRGAATGREAVDRRDQPSRSVVGGTTSCASPENATMPMRVSFGWSATNLRATSCATESRLGCDIGRAHRPRHVQRQDDRRAADRRRDHACGRAAAIARLGHRGEQSANGTRRRQRDRPGMRLAISERLAKLTAKRRRRREHRYDDDQISGRTSEQRRAARRSARQHHPSEPGIVSRRAIRNSRAPRSRERGDLGLRPSP